MQRGELVERLMRLLPADGLVEPHIGVRIRRVSAPTELGHGVSFPSFCVIAQGSKEIWLGNTCLRYDPDNYLIASATLPIATRIVHASLEEPYLGIVFRLDPLVVGAVLAEAMRPVSHHTGTAAIGVNALEPQLLDTVVRYVRLLDTPADAAVLLPLCAREMIYRLLCGAQGERLQYIVASDGATRRIFEAVRHIRSTFAQPLSIEQLAHEAGMSVSSFHAHFRALTALSPLQFQKQLRLHEARRLMVGEGLTAASAGYHVGYDNASHFTREYKRLFGAPPAHDVARQRAIGQTASDAELSTGTVIA